MSSSPDFLLNENKQFTQQDFLSFLNSFNETYLQIATQVNAKDYGYYSPSAEVNGQRWYSTPQDYKTIYRKRIDVGALLNNGAKSTAHGITITANTVVTRLYGAATDPSTTFIPLPYVAAAPIYLSMDGTNVIVQTTDDKTGFTASFVIVEFIQN